MYSHLVKNDFQIEKIKAAGKVVARVHRELKSMIKAGVSLLELDEKARKIILEEKCIPSFLGYGGFPNSICASVNEVLIHGIPSEYRLKEKDLVSIDVGACYKGYHADAAFSMFVEKSPSETASKLMVVTEQALMNAISIIKHGTKLIDVCAIIENTVSAAGFFIPRNYAGHGIGSSLHEDPLVPNLKNQAEDIILQKGMTIAIEPMVIVGTNKTRVLNDG